MHESMKRLYKAAKEIKGIETPTDLALLMKESQQTIKNWEYRGISKGGLLKAQSTIGCMADWLETGKGPMRPGMVSEPTPSYGLGQLQTWDDSTPLDDDEVEVPLFKEVQMAAGNGTCHSIEINGRKLRFSKATMRAAGVDEANAACATITGNSMERLILDGATVGIDRGRTQIMDGEIYAIDHDGMLRVKYLYRLPGGGLRLRSENADEHPDESYSPEDAQKIRVLGWVFWWSTVRKWRGK